MDKKTFLLLITGHQATIHKICRLYRETREDREDLFQEIIFQLWKSFSAFRGEAKPGTWIYRIALNTAIVSFRKKKTVISYMDSIPEMPDPSGQEEIPVQLEQLLWAIRQLNDGEKAIITLYLEDLTHKEIAEIIGISENYVGVKINRIKSGIQQLIKKRS